MKAFFGLGFMQILLKAQVDFMPEDPSEAALRAGHAVLVGVARNGAGQIVRSRLRTPESYALTALTAFDAAKRGVRQNRGRLPDAEFSVRSRLHFVVRRRHARRPQ
jgi:hypothetical protein